MTLRYVFIWSPFINRVGQSMNAGGRHVLVCMLVALSMTVLQSCSATTSIAPVSTGLTLYVGGDGPGNYTTIQAAIDHASAGDTVYVYDNHAPYHETVLINHTITLAGEQTNTTIIDGTNLAGDLLTIVAPHVTLHGFTLRHTQKDGVIIHSDHALVSDLFITDCTLNGIFLYKSGMTPIEGCSIHDITVTGTSYGIAGYVCNNSLFTRNTLRGNYGGITFINSFHNNISFNTFDNNTYGVIDSFSGSNHYLRNLITNSTTTGFKVIASARNIVEKNTFQHNKQNAWFLNFPLIERYNKLLSLVRNDTYFFDNYRVFGATAWKGNYWGEPRSTPYPIFGRSSLLPMTTVIPNRVEFDLLPARQPTLP